MRWLWKSRRKSTQDDEMDLARAKSMRIQAEQKLREAREAAREVMTVAIESRRIRAQNQFSQRLSEAFGSRPNHNG